MVVDDIGNNKAYTLYLYVMTDGLYSLHGDDEGAVDACSARQHVRLCVGDELFDGSTVAQAWGERRGGGRWAGRGETATSFAAG